MTMTREELEDQLERLANGFEAMMPKEKLDAYWFKFKHINTEDFRDAVTSALCDPRFPTLERLWDYVEKAGEIRRRALVSQGDRDAKGFFNGEARGDETPLTTCLRFALLTALRKGGNIHRTMVNEIKAYVDQHGETLGAGVKPFLEQMEHYLTEADAWDAKPKDVRHGSSLPHVGAIMGKELRP